MNEGNFDTVSLESYPTNSIKYKIKDYSKDDIELEMNDLETEMCQICFNIIWDHKVLQCPNEICNNSYDRNICVTCSEQLYDKAYQDKIDLLCPFCRTTIIQKEDLVIEDNNEHAVPINDNEDIDELIIIYNPRLERYRTAYCLLYFLVGSFLLYVFYVIILNVPVAP